MHNPNLSLGQYMALANINRFAFAMGSWVNLYSR